MLEYKRPYELRLELDDNGGGGRILFGWYGKSIHDQEVCRQVRMCLYTASNIWAGVEEVETGRPRMRSEEDQEAWSSLFT